jgi:predicted dehydrogenase
MQQIGIAIIGSGRIALANHLPGLKLCPHARLVALCDTNEAVLAEAVRMTGVKTTYTDYREALRRDDVDAVIIATPNFTHTPIVLDAVREGKHVLCEKPLALSFGDALEMYREAERRQVRHMTAFTYRFVPAMRYAAHLVQRGDVGRPYHFRANRFQDWGDRGLGWRQVRRLAGSGELGDMLSHRIDYGHLLAGQTERVVADMRQVLERRAGEPSDVDDWVAVISHHQTGATGVLESTKMASGRGEGAYGRDYAEINGSDGTVVTHTQRPHEVQIGRKGGRDLETVPIPEEFLKWPGSPRDPHAGDPLIVFRYDQAFEFIDAIANSRPCNPSFKEGAMTQAVMDAVIESAEQRRWVEVAGVS